MKRIKVNNEIWLYKVNKSLVRLQSPSGESYIEEINFITGEDPSEGIYYSEIKHYILSSLIVRLKNVKQDNFTY